MFRNGKYIYTVYQTGSFSAAAKMLYITQPCLSAMVKKTEQQLGVPIFDRKSKPLQLTEYGAQYITYLEKTWELKREFEQYLNDVRGLRTGQLSIGANNVFASFILPPLIRRFNDTYPGVQVQMTEGNISYLEQGLAQGTLDLVIDNCPMDDTLFQQRLLGTEHLLIAAHCAAHDASAHHRCRLTHSDILAGRHLADDAPVLSMQAFSSAPFIVLKRGNDTRIRTDAICEQAGFSPRIQLEVDQLATAYNIVCSGLGVTLVSDTLLCKTAPFPDIWYYKLQSDQTTRAVYLYHRHARYITNAMHAFMETASAVLTRGVASL